MVQEGPRGVPEGPGVPGGVPEGSQRALGGLRGVPEGVPEGSQRPREGFQGSQEGSQEGSQGSRSGPGEWIRVLEGRSLGPACRFLEQFFEYRAFDARDLTGYWRLLAIIGDCWARACQNPSTPGLIRLSS